MRLSKKTQFLHSLLLISLFALAAASECGHDGRVVLPIGLFSSSDLLRTSEAIPAAELAIHQVNNDSSILERYCLKGLVYDTECKDTNAIEDMYTFLDVDPGKLNGTVAEALFIIGGGCPDKTDILSTMAEFVHALEIDYSLSEAKYSVDTLHMMPKLTHVRVATHNFMEAIGVKEFTWFQENVKEFTHYPLGDLPHWNGEERAEIWLLCNVNFCNEIGIQKHLMNTSKTVYFLEGHADVLRESACKAIQLGAVYPHKLWFIYGMEGGEWWEWDAVQSPTNCSKEDVKRFLDRAITVVPTFDGEIKGTQPEEPQLAEVYRSLQNISRRHLHVHEPLIYDAVWMVAEALHRFTQALLTTYNYILKPRIQIESYFEPFLLGDEAKPYYGLTGEALFNRTNGLFRTANRLIALQYRLLPSGVLVQVPIANITFDSPDSFKANVEFLEGHTLESVLPDGVPEPPTTIILTVSWLAAGFIIAFAFMGVIFALVCIVMTCALRNRRVIKMNSPRLDIVIALGAILWYASTTMKVIPTTDLTTATLLCEVWRWGWSIGSTLFFVPVLLKNWRVYYIFHNPTHRKIALQDWKLFLVLAAFLLFDVFLLTVSSAVAQTRLNAQFSYSAPFEKHIDCITGHSYISLILLACYKLVLAIIGSVLAVLNRKVKIPELREAKLVGLATYSFLFAVTVTIATMFAAKDVRLRAIVVSAEGLCTLTFLLILLFVPKVYGGIRSGKWKREDRRDDTTTFTDVSAAEGLENLHKYTLAAMQSEISSLKKELKKHEKSGVANEEASKFDGVADVDVQNEGKHVNICVEEVNVAIHVYEELQEPAENAQRLSSAGHGLSDDPASLDESTSHSIIDGGKSSSSSECTITGETVAYKETCTD